MGVGGGGRLVGSIRTRDARKDGACKHRSDGDERVVLSSDSLRVRTRSLKTSREGKRRGCVFLFLFFFFDGSQEEAAGAEPHSRDATAVTALDRLDSHDDALSLRRRCDTPQHTSLREKKKKKEKFLQCHPRRRAFLCNGRRFLVGCTSVFGRTRSPS